MVNFEYLEPKTVEEACSLLSKHKGEAKLIAGGTALLPLMRQRLINPPYLINIKGILSLDYIRWNQEEGLSIGALTTHRTVETSPIIGEKFKVLALTAQKMGSVQMRNLGTLGGNLCHADPAADLPTPLIALNTLVKTFSPSGERVIKLEEFFKDYYETILQPDEILTGIKIPNPLPHTGIVYLRYSLRKAMGLAIVGIAVSISLDTKDNFCKEAKIVLGGVAPHAVRARKAEDIIQEKIIPGDLMDMAAHQASEEVSPTSDVHASSEYRKEMVKVFTKRALKEALEQAK